ncbi:MAG: hypothetical protein HDT46_08045 [Ruminococcaceae bacterium]|nr:hypothetical protein [Oscillospiraceae bacterium]
MFDSERVIAVCAEYHVNYNPSATYVNDGDCGQYFYLWQDEESLEWHTFESSYNHRAKGLKFFGEHTVKLLTDSLLIL